MITNTGKGILAKYLLGQAPAYASYIAIGCGRSALQTGDSLSPYRAEFSSKESLDFEMFRVPIVSRGYVTEPDTTIYTISNIVGDNIYVTYTVTPNHSFAPGDIVDIAGVSDITDYNMSGATVYDAPSPSTFRVKSPATGVWTSGGTVIGRITKLALTAELPTEQRYEMTEIGVYSAKANPSATNKDSRIIYTFTETENWEYHGTASAIGIGAAITSPLSADMSAGVINPSLGVAPAFRATSNNTLFSSDARLTSNDRCRFLNTAIYIPGNTSQLEKNIPTDELYIKFDGTESQNKEFGKHIHLAGTRVNLSQNSPEDELRLAFSIIHKDETSQVEPTKAYMVVMFSSDESSADANNFAKMQIDITSGFDNSHYHIVKSKLSELVKGTTFSWGSVSLVKVYVSIYGSANVVGREFVASTSTATITTDIDHGFSVGTEVEISDVNNALFNGKFIITGVPTSKTFTFELSNPSNITYASTTGSAEAPSSNYFVGLDALRLENVSTINPLYGLTGYTVIKTDSARPIVKEANTSNLVEFRFGLDVM